MGDVTAANSFSSWCHERVSGAYRCPPASLGKCCSGHCTRGRVAGLKYHRTHHSDNPSTQLVTPPPITAKGVGEAKQQPQQPPLSCICPPVYNQPPRIRCGLTLKGTGPLKEVAGIEKAGPYRKLVFLRNPKALRGPHSQKLKGTRGQDVG